MAELQHRIVYAESGIYAGWPANHGGWQWPNENNGEFLVGFLRGKYGRKSMHNIREPFQKMLARSTDGGETWALETPNVDFDCKAAIEPPPAFDLATDIIRVCGVYDHGGDQCDEGGGFYLSRDKGHRWSGPFVFVGLENQFSEDLICTARTAVLPSRSLVFLSSASANHWGTDTTFCAAHNGKKFVPVAQVGPAAHGRVVMPAVAIAGDRIVCAARRRHGGQRSGWIDAYGSDDGGYRWQFLAQVGVTGAHNGNPPALAALPDGRLACAFGDRTNGQILCAISEDGGVSWERKIVLRTYPDIRLHDVDLGYPRLFLRADGQLACVYYLATFERPQQHIACTIFRA